MAAVAASARLAGPGLTHAEHAVTAQTRAEQADARQAATGKAATGQVPGSGRPDRPTAGIWRRWRLPLAIIGLVLLGAVAIALLQPPSASLGYLDPADVGPGGTHALADILAQRGEPVTRAVSPAAALAAAAGGATLVVTGAQYLTGGQLAGLGRAPGSLMLVAPDAAALAALAPGVRLVGPALIGPAPARCRLTAAVLAGNADMGGLALRPRPGLTGAVGCYPQGPPGALPSLVRYLAGGRVITVLGTGTPLTNQYLGQLGNAALALNLLSSSQPGAGQPGARQPGAGRRIVWLAPPPIPPGAGGRKSLTSLIPLGTYLIAAQLGIAVLVTALWRARRLGPLVPEQLPVVVRASETVEGHARLYASRRARGAAAAALREAAAGRLMTAAGLPPGAPPDAVTAALAARSTTSPAKIEMMLFGPLPGSDSALVTLASELDALEREVRAQ